MTDWWQAVLAGVAGGLLPSVVAVAAIRTQLRSSNDERTHQRQLLAATHEHEQEQQWRVRAAESYSDAVTLAEVLPSVIDSLSTGMGVDALKGLAIRCGDVIRELHVLQAIGTGATAEAAGRCASLLGKGMRPLYEVAAQILTDPGGLEARRKGYEIVKDLRAKLEQPLADLQRSLLSGSTKAAG